MKCSSSVGSVFRDDIQVTSHWTLDCSKFIAVTIINQLPIGLAMKVSCIYFAGILFLLTGCGQDVQSVDYYKAHLDEAKAVKEECKIKKDNGTLEGTQLSPSPEYQNCMNASSALFHSGGLKPIKGDEKVLKTW